MKVSIALSSALDWISEPLYAFVFWVIAVSQIFHFHFVFLEVHNKCEHMRDVVLHGLSERICMVHWYLTGVCVIYSVICKMDRTSELKRTTGILVLCCILTLYINWDVNTTCHTDSDEHKALVADGES